MATPEGEVEPQWTLLVCMPRCQAAHPVIVRELLDHGVDIVARRFTLTPDQALVIVKQYTYLRRRATEPDPSTSVAPAAAPVGAPAQPSSSSELRRTGWPEPPFQQAPVRLPHLKSQQQAKSQAESGQLLANIMRLAQGHRTQQKTGPSPVTICGKGVDCARGAVAPPSFSAALFLHENKEGGSGENSEPTLSSPRAAPHSACAAREATPVPYQSGRPHALSSPSATASPKRCTSGADGHTFASDPQALQQVESLLHGGTVLVLLLRAVKAVELLVRLAGPEDPHEAQRVAPGSWSARYGASEAQMGVYTPSSRTDARAAVQAVFGEQCAPRTDHSKSQVHLQERLAHGLGGAFPVIAAPPAAPLSFAQILLALRAGLPTEQRISYYTGVHDSAPLVASTIASTSTAVAEGLDALASVPQASIDSGGNAVSAATMRPDSCMYQSTFSQ
ncbi:hypothetical protein LSCM1_07108 [Leishmania martiniquensis]|uniref:Nucleoside diphosphate kinase-like domain-containing protein n=1 Tax=Leishmania martiniquensis TaxID=1580590 RepID=A0A836HP89_9TRYP|nr:hypothetical protein LSCM1_07108 [Leishmania martiniquensis]